MSIYLDLCSGYGVPSYCGKLLCSCSFFFKTSKTASLQKLHPLSIANGDIVDFPIFLLKITASSSSSFFFFFLIIIIFAIVIANYGPFSS